MNDNPLLLLLRLEGVLQAWGERARWDFRDTSGLPTKSGVLGMIGCALGVKRGDPRFIKWNDTMVMGIRIDNPGTVMDDYHTVQGEILNAEGKKRGNTIVSKRQYLQDASFLVCLQGERELLELFWLGLKNPVWPVYLGRRCCVPSRPVYECLTTEYRSIEDAFKLYPVPNCSEVQTVLCEIEDSNGYSKRKDAFLNLRSRQYRSRKVQYKPVDLEVSVQDVYIKDKF